MHCFSYQNILLNLFPGNELEGGMTNIYLRLRGSTTLEVTPLLGPTAPGKIFLEGDTFQIRGHWLGIDFKVELALAQESSAWFWHVELTNTKSELVTVDLIYTHDLALALSDVIGCNEYFVSQYLDYRSLLHAQRGVVLAARQNLPMNGGHPWALVGSLRQGVGFANDAWQLFGFNRPQKNLPLALGHEHLPNQILQHEHSLAAVQDSPIDINAGDRVRAGFFGFFSTDHSLASSDKDLDIVNQVLELVEAKASDTSNSSMAASKFQVSRDLNLTSERQSRDSLFTQCRSLSCLDLTERDLLRFWPGPCRQKEMKGPDWLSFFWGSNVHVVSKVKEMEVLRPHGLIMRTGAQLFPEENSLTTTVWMSGVFNSMVTQGNTSTNRILSPTKSYLNLFRSYGQRIFVEQGGEYLLLEVPSAFEMNPQCCRWIYKHEGGVIEVRTDAAIHSHELNLEISVVEGSPCRFLITEQLAADKGRYPLFHWQTEEDLPLGSELVELGDERLFLDGQSRGLNYRCLMTSIGQSFHWRMSSGLQDTKKSKEDGRVSGLGVADREGTHLSQVTFSTDLLLVPPQESPLATHIHGLQDSIPWMKHNALIHFLAPRGLEQYVAGAWGTRDVTQGPVELLRSMGEMAAWRKVLLEVFSAQNFAGDWPQWFMFFEEQKYIRSGECHSDIVFWPLLSLAEYLIDSEDAQLLEEKVNYFDKPHEGGSGDFTIWHHLESAMSLIDRSCIAGTPVVAYGNGDWDDSMVAIDMGMRQRLCSSWTVTLQYQTLMTLAKALRRLGFVDKAQQLTQKAELVREFFQEHLMVDGVIAGFVEFGVGGEKNYLIHPKDQQTGVRYRLIPMVHGILSEILSPEQIEPTLNIVRDHLVSPDGARLSDRPLVYRGGPRKLFDRAESSAFFGREIGLMYNHAHLRYAQSLAVCGRSEEFFVALDQAHAIGFCHRLSRANIRQLNCFYSSSDALFNDRYQSFQNYDEIKQGEVRFEGGWRIYSSGPGLFLRLVHDYFLGLRRGSKYFIFDPVIEKSLDGLRVHTAFDNHRVEIVYRVKEKGCGLRRLVVNGDELKWQREVNPYRLGGGAILIGDLFQSYHKDQNEMIIEVD